MRHFSLRDHFAATAAGLLFAFLLTPATAHSTSEDAARALAAIAWLERNVPMHMQSSKVPGVSVAIQRRGETIYAAGFGARDPARNLPATADTLYGIGSITKSFVAIAVLQLVESGQLALTDPASRFLPLALGDKDPPITVHNLLTHSSGLPGIGSSTVLLDRGMGLDTGVPLVTAADFYRFVNGARGEIVAPPGARYFYSNEGWRLLGHLVQLRAGTPFHEYLTRRVIRPLGMTRTTLELKQFEADPDHIVPHRRTAEGMVAARFPYPDLTANGGEASFLGAAGGIASSVREMSRYVDAQIRLGRTSSGRLASEESFRRIQTVQIRTPDDLYGPTGYGYGLRVTDDFLGHRLLSHGGSIVVSTAHMAFIPDLEIGVVMMGNASGMPFGRMAESVLAILMGVDPQTLPGARLEAHMDSLEGRYRAYLGLEQLDIVADDGALFVAWPAEGGARPERTQLIPDDPTTDPLSFHTWAYGVRSPVDFARKEDVTLVCIGSACYRRVP